MPRVLLTRPVADSERLARALTQGGYDSVIDPLLTIGTYEAPAPDCNGLQAVMLTSAHAPDFLDASFSVSAGLLRLPCFCVGLRTADAARAYGFVDVREGQGDGVDLATQMAGALDPDHGAVLHVTGRDSDARGRETLQRQGFTVRAWPVYAAVAAETLQPGTVTQLQQGHINAVLLFSARTAELLKRLLILHGLGPCCQQVIALGISDRILPALGGLPWRQIAAAPSPSQHDMLQRLHELLPASLA